MTFLITVPAVMLGCFLYDLVMNAVLKFTTKRAMKKLEAQLGGMEGELMARLDELKAKEAK